MEKIGQGQVEHSMQNYEQGCFITFTRSGHGEPLLRPHTADGEGHGKTLLGPYTVHGAGHGETLFGPHAVEMAAKHRHTSHTPPVTTGLVKPKPNPLIPLSTHTAPSIHISHTPPTPLTTLISSTSPVLDKTPEPPLPPTATTSPRTPHQHCRQPRTLSQDTHRQHKQQYMHHSHRNNRTHNIGYYDNLTDGPRTTSTTQAHRPSSKSESNLIILQVNINGLKNKLEELKLFIHDKHADIITIQETKLTPKVKTPKST